MARVLGHVSGCVPRGYCSSRAGCSPGHGSVAPAGCAASAHRLEGSSFSLGLALMQPRSTAEGLSGAFLMQVADLP